MANEAIVDDYVVNVHLYQPSFQGCIVYAVTIDPRVPTTHVAKSKLANTLASDPPNSCAKSFVPLRKYMDSVLVVVDGVKKCNIFLLPVTPFPVIIYTNIPAGKN